MADLSTPSDELFVQVAQLCAGGLEGFGGGFLKAFHGKEREFLRIGALLEQFNSRAVAASSLARELAGLTSGEFVVGASSRLSDLLEKLGRICEESDLPNEIRELSDIASIGLKLNDILRDFNRLVKHLSMLGVSTRIESARLGDKGLGFSTLADDVETLAGKISQSSEKILASATELTTQCRSASVSLERMGEARRNCSLSALDMLQNDLGALETLTETSRSIADHLSARSGEVVQSVSAAVHSMQFHDIIRQQLEHVGEAAADARSLALDGPGRGKAHDAADWQEVCDWLRTMLELQQSQLGNARMRFAQAVENLEEGLNGIAARVGEMASEAASLSVEEQGQEGSLGQIEALVAQIADAMREYGNLERDMSEVMRQVAGSVRVMSSTVAEIEEVGSEIELIAINASIKAAHTGDEGKALGVLASAIQKLSVDARSQTVNILELLGAVDQTSFERRAMVNLGANLETLVQSLDSEMTNLKKLDKEASAKAVSLQRNAEIFSRDMADAVGSLDFCAELLDNLTQSEVRLEELLHELRVALPVGTPASTAPALLQMLKRYTMDEERLVHDQVLGLGAGTEGGAQADGDGFGDNVELF